MRTPSRAEELAYRTIGWKIGTGYPEWTLDDIRSGRSQRIRFLTCGLLVGGMLLFGHWAVARRTGIYETMIGSLIGLPFGLGIGALIVRFTNRTARQDKFLKYQGLLPDGRIDPAPRGMARLTNYDVGAIQAASLAFLGLTVGAFPMLAFPIPFGRCVDAPASDVAALRATVRPGVSLSHEVYYRQGGLTYLAARVDDPDPKGADGIGIWVKVSNHPRFSMLDAISLNATIALPAPQRAFTATAASNDGAVKARDCAAAG